MAQAALDKNVTVMFDPFTLNGGGIRNRIVFAPFQENHANKNGLVTPRLMEYYLEMARNGAGAVIVESTYVARQGRGHVNQLGISEERHIEGLARLSGAIKAEGGTPGIRLSHAGARTSELICGEQPVGPAILSFGKDFNTSREFDEGDIEEIILFFVHAAERAEEAGFEFIEIDGSHQRLLDQCLSLRYNTRTDAFGGPIEKRMVLSSKIIKAIKGRVSGALPVSYLFSIHEKLEEGFSSDDLKAMIKVLTSAKVDWFHPVSLHVLNKFFETEETLVEWVGRFTRKPIIAEGNMKSPQILKEVLNINKASLFALDKQIFSRPNWLGFLEKKIAPPQ